MRKERECGGNGSGEEGKSRRKKEKMSAGGVMEQLGSSFTLHCGLALQMTLSSVCVRECVCVLRSTSDRCPILNPAT